MSIISKYMFSTLLQLDGMSHVALILYLLIEFKLCFVKPKNKEVSQPCLYLFMI